MGHQNFLKKKGCRRAVISPQGGPAPQARRTGPAGGRTRPRNRRQAGQGSFLRWFFFKIFFLYFILFILFFSVSFFSFTFKFIWFLFFILVTLASSLLV